jgi:hypothetical protein
MIKWNSEPRIVILYGAISKVPWYFFDLINWQPSKMLGQPDCPYPINWQPSKMSGQP